jgi:hypothetical protein
MTKLIGVALLCAALSSCVINPHHSQHTGTRATPIRFEIFSITPNASITVTCSHHYGNVMNVTSFTGGSNPITYAGQTVYAKTMNITLPQGCWEPWSGPNYSYITYIRVKQGGYNSAVFDEAGLDCLFDEIGDGTGPITAGINCRYDGSDILLFANP